MGQTDSRSIAADVEVGDCSVTRSMVVVAAAAAAVVVGDQWAATGGFAG